MRQHLKGQKRTEVFLGGESDFDWEPPLLTQELAHSSQDEIVPNPKAYFVPRAAMQQGGNKQGKVTVVPCFPVSGKSRSERVTPYDRPEAYRSITSWLPSDQDKLQMMATRSGADTCFKVSARQHVGERVDDLTEDGTDDATKHLVYFESLSQYVVMWQTTHPCCRGSSLILWLGRLPLV